MERNGYTDYNDENDTAIGAGTSLVGRTQDITLGMPIVNAASGDYDDYDNNNDDIKNDSDNNDYANDHDETTTGSDKQPFWDEAKAVLLPHASLPIQEEENLMSRSQTDDHHLQKNISSAGCRKEGKTDMDVIQHSTHCNEIKTRVQKKEEEEDKTQIQDDCRDEVACGGCNVMNSSIFGDGGIFQTSIIDEEPRTSLNKNDDESVVAVMKEEEEEEEEEDCCHGGGGGGGGGGGVTRRDHMESLKITQGKTSETRYYTRNKLDAGKDTMSATATTTSLNLDDDDDGILVRRRKLQQQQQKRPLMVTTTTTTTTTTTPPQQQGLDKEKSQIGSNHQQPVVLRRSSSTPGGKKEFVPTMEVEGGGNKNDGEEEALVAVVAAKLVKDDERAVTQKNDDSKKETLGKIAAKQSASSSSSSSSSISVTASSSSSPAYRRPSSLPQILYPTKIKISKTSSITPPSSSKSKEVPRIDDSKAKKRRRRSTTTKYFGVYTNGKVGFKAQLQSRGNKM